MQQTITPVITQTIIPTVARITEQATSPIVQVLEPIAQLGKGEVYASVLSPDGQYLAVSSAAGVYLYESQTFETIWFQQTDKAFNILAFSPDSKWLALVKGFDRHEENQPEIWEIENGKRVLTLPLIRGCESITWSPDGTELLSMSYAGEINRWQANAGILLKQIQPPEDNCYEYCYSINAIWSSDGKRIIASSSLKLKIWDAFTGKELFVLTREILGILPGRATASIAPDDHRVVLGAYDIERGAQVIDSLTGQVLHTIDSWLAVRDIAWSPDGKILALTASGHKTIELWDAATYTLIKSFHVIDVVRGMDWSSDGLTLFVSNDSQVVAIRASDGEILRSLSGYAREIMRIQWEHQQSIQVEVLFEGVTIWNSATLEISTTIQQEINYDRPTIVWSPDKRIKASFAGRMLLLQEGTLTEVQLKTPFNMAEMETPVMAWSPDGTMLGVGSSPNPDEDGIVQIWNIPTATLLYQWIDIDRIAALAWSPDGKHIAVSAGESGQISIRDIETGNILFRLQGHKTQARGLAWSPDGQMIVSGDFSGKIFLWKIPANP